MERLYPTLVDYKSPISIVPNESKAYQTSNSFTFNQEMVNMLLVSGLSKSTIAANIKTSIWTVNNILKGKVKTIRSKTFFKLLGLYCYYRYTHNEL